MKLFIWLIPVFLLQECLREKIIIRKNKNNIVPDPVYLNIVPDPVEIGWFEI